MEVSRTLTKRQIRLKLLDGKKVLLERMPVSYPAVGAWLVERLLHKKCHLLMEVRIRLGTHMVANAPAMFGCTILDYIHL